MCQWRFQRRHSQIGLEGQADARHTEQAGGKLSARKQHRAGRLRRRRLGRRRGGPSLRRAPVAAALEQQPPAGPAPPPAQRLRSGPLLSPGLEIGRAHV